MWDVIVVGTGVMGAASLASLAAAGLKVLGIDRFSPPHAFGSSHGETRVTRKAYFEDPRYVPLLHRAFERYVALENEVGVPLFEPTRGLHFGRADHEGMLGVARAVREHGLPHFACSADAAGERFAIQPAASDSCIVEEQAGVLAAEPMVAALLQVAVKRGAVVRSGERVFAIEPGNADVTVRTGRDAFVASRVVLATGAWAASGELVPAPAPLVVERQVQLWFEARDPAPFTAPTFPIFIGFGEAQSFYGIPIVTRFGGLSARAVKVCQHHGGVRTTADDIDRVVSPADEASVRAFVRDHLPLLADAPIVERRVCMYTNTPDEHFVVGPHPDARRVVVAAGFSGHGFKLAPVVGDLVRDLVIGGAAPHPLFDPLRFRAR